VGIEQTPANGSAIPPIILSRCGGESSRRSALAGGPRGLQPKPFSSPNDGRVRAALRKRATGSPPRPGLIHGALTVDLGKRRRVTVEAGYPVSRKEYGILRCGGPILAGCDNQQRCARWFGARALEARITAIQRASATKTGR